MSIQAKVTGTPNPRAVQLLLDAVDEFLWQQELKRRAVEIDRIVNYEADGVQMESVGIADVIQPETPNETDALETRLQMVCRAG
ncbi:MAG: hypothetical protein JW963_25035 [Anaerolineales bacterium]|nr:hypothetical protein [Anaerolineales bacterium]